VKYTVEMGSVTVIYIPDLVEIGTGIRKLIRRDSQIHSQHRDRISILLFFHNNESRLKNKLRRQKFAK
jgi:hypothetical protein